MPSNSEISLDERLKEKKQISENHTSRQIRIVNFSKRIFIDTLYNTHEYLPDLFARNIFVDLLRSFDIQLKIVIMKVEVEIVYIWS